MTTVKMKRELVVVYTVGKVASSTISESIRAAGINCNDVHVMVPSKLLGVLSKHAERNVFPPPHIAESLLIRREFFSKYSNVKLITLIRDCPSRNISCVFQNLARDEKITVDSVSERIEAMHFNPFSPWFKNELKEVSGIDVMASPFDRDARWQRYQNGRFELLLMRTDLGDLEKSAQLKSYLGRDVPLTSANVASEKWYAKLYSDFQDYGRLSSKWLDSALNNKFMTHFYHPGERDAIRQKYERFTTR